jgi:MYXO-CTERM domain-containing protein
MRLLLACPVVATFILTVDPSAADACSAPQCWPGSITPRDATPVPSNLPGIYWQPLRGGSGAAETDPGNVVLATAAAPSTGLPFTTMPLANGAVLLVPDQPLVENTTYVVTDLNNCGGSVGGPTASFVVGPAAPLPTFLGSISVTSEAVESRDVASSSGSCSTEVTAHRVTITPELIAEARPWTSVFHFDVLVDGEVWQQTDSINNFPDVRGTWQLFRTCPSTTLDPGAAPGLGAGAHTVSVRATIPGTSYALSSDEITVDMHCPGEPGSNIDGDDDGGGCQATPSSSLPWHAVVMLGVLAAITRRRQRRAR